jgi:hypothetical protein
MPLDARAPDGAHIEEESKRLSEEREESKVVALRPDRFAELQAIWQRPWPDDEAAGRRAFAKACAMAEPDTIIAAAAAWVAAADAPRYLPPLAKWLDGKAWEKPPPTRKRTQGQLSLGPAGKQFQRRKQDLTALCLAHGSGELKINTPMWGDGQ